MRQFKNIVIFSFLLYSSTLFAGGLGVYMLNVIDENSYYDDETGKDYGYSPGIGVTYDTNIGKNSLFNYRLGIDYYKARGTSTFYDYDMNGTRSTLQSVDVKKSTLSLVNTFGFGVYRSKNLRLWLGPQITVMRVKENDYYNDYSIDFSAGPALGLNYNLNDDVALSIDATLMALGETTSTMVRLYAIWRFNETFKVTAPKLHGSANYNADMGEKLRYLQSLRDEGILTEEELQKKRQEIISDF